MIIDVTRMADLDNLIDAAEVAQILNLSHRNSVRVYRRRYHDFPAPVVDMGAGRCLLWIRSEVEAWAEARRS